MNASLWLAAGLVCAQLALTEQEESPGTTQVAAQQAGGTAASRPAASKIVAVTVYHGQALVTRDVSVPEGDGIIELVVAPMPPEVVENSLYTEGAEGLRVLSTRFRTRTVNQDTRQEVRTKEELIRKLQADSQRLQQEIAVQEQNLKYLQKLEGFTSTTMTSLTEKGRLDSEAILTLSKFVMENRGAKSKAEVDLRQQLQATNEASDLAKQQLAELSAGSSRVERDAVIVVNKSRRGGGSVRLGYLVDSATWTPQYRLKGAADNAPVRLEYLAAVVQQTGEDWPAVRVTLSTARPTLDAAPPNLLPLKIDIADPVDFGPIEAGDNRSQRVVAELGKLMDFQLANPTPLEDVISYVRKATSGRTFPDGLPIYVDPVGLQEAERTLTSPVTLDLTQIPIRTGLRLMLKQLGMTYIVKDGLVTITSETAESLAGDRGEASQEDAGGEAGMGVPGVEGAGQVQAAGAAKLNRAAASDQDHELRFTDGSGSTSHSAEKDNPSVAFSVSGALDIPSRRDPQLLEVARIELPAEYYAKAVPVLTPRVYRLAKLTNKSDFVLLPGEATVHVGSDFVGRMRLPLVAAGEPFIAGFGVDPQLQVSRRLIKKTRTVQGGNQVFNYEFRLGLRNYRSVPVKFQLWDRLPKPNGESVVASLAKTTVELSNDASYQRTARNDNLLRWDLEVPAGTVGEKTMYLSYEFRLEYARDLPQPHFVSGGLREAPIGGGAMGGMGGMGAGMRSVRPTRTEAAR